MRSWAPMLRDCPITTIKVMSTLITPTICFLIEEPYVADPLLGWTPSPGESWSSSGTTSRGGNQRSHDATDHDKSAKRLKSCSFQMNTLKMSLNLLLMRKPSRRCPHFEGGPGGQTHLQDLEMTCLCVEGAGWPRGGPGTERDVCAYLLTKTLVFLSSMGSLLR